MNNTPITGRIFDIQHFCIHDGPGIRTTVFFKGCPLRCLWCHNPEGIDPKPNLSFDPLKCVGCLACTKECPAVHKMGEKGHYLDRRECSLCGKCVKVCVTHALELIGSDLTVEEISGELLKDSSFYKNSSGGITLSGGEPVAQHEFLLQLVTYLKKKNMHIALETSGFYDFDIYTSLLPYIDLFLFDYKETDPELHKQYTGVSNELILKNLGKLYNLGAKILLRCPIIPGLNDQKEHLQGIAGVSAEFPNLEGVELLPYHNLGCSKAKRMGLNAQKEFPKIAVEMIRNLAEEIRSYGGKKII
jgi:pyruvate formate lyase activating enzyme